MQYHRINKFFLLKKILTFCKLYIQKYKQLHLYLLKLLIWFTTYITRVKYPKNMSAYVEVFCTINSVQFKFKILANQTKSVFNHMIKTE